MTPDQKLAISRMVSADEALQAKKWRQRFAIFMCLLAFAVLVGVLAGGLK